MSQPISEAELIEADFVVDCLEAGMVDILGSWRDPKVTRWHNSGKVGRQVLRRLIDQARAANSKGITESVNHQGQGIAND